MVPLAGLMLYIYVGGEGVPTLSFIVFPSQREISCCIPRYIQLLLRRYIGPSGPVDEKYFFPGQELS